MTSATFEYQVSVSSEVASRHHARVKCQLTSTAFQYKDRNIIPVTLSIDIGLQVSALNPPQGFLAQRDYQLLNLKRISVSSSI